jgi:molybdopterin converting factor small subunit
MKVRTSGVLLRFVDYRKERDLDVGTVREALDQLADQHPDLRRVLFDGDGNVRRTHHVYLNGERLGADDLGRQVSERDEVDILTAVAGG